MAKPYNSEVLIDEPCRLVFGNIRKIQRTWISTSKGYVLHRCTVAGVYFPVLHPDELGYKEGATCQACIDTVPDKIYFDWKFIKL